MIRGTPVAFVLSVCAATALLGIGLWFFFSFRFDTRTANLESAIVSKDSQMGILQSTIAFQAEQLSTFRQLSLSLPKRDQNLLDKVDTTVELQFPADFEKGSIKLLSATNIWRWNYMVSRLAVAGQDKPVFAAFAIVLVFDKPTTFKTISISSSTNQLPAWSLTDSSERTAMMMFWGDVSNRSISFRLNP